MTLTHGLKPKAFFNLSKYYTYLRSEVLKDEEGGNFRKLSLPNMYLVVF